MSVTVVAWVHLGLAAGGLLFAILSLRGFLAPILLLTAAAGTLSGRHWARVLSLGFWLLVALFTAVGLYLGQWGTVEWLAATIIWNVIIVYVLTTSHAEAYFDPPPWAARSLKGPLVAPNRYSKRLWIFLCIFVLFSLGGEFILSPLANSVGAAIALSYTWMLTSLLLGLALFGLTLAYWRHLGTVQRVVNLLLPAGVMLLLVFAFTVP